MDIEVFKQKCDCYEKLEGRAKFYDIAVEIVDKFPLQASIIILAVWNVAGFRFLTNEEYREALNKLKNIIEKSGTNTTLNPVMNPAFEAVVN